MNTQPSLPRTYTESFADGLTLKIDERGSGRPMLVLHGGGGPLSVAGLSEALSKNAHVLTPIHPGFAGTPRPAWFDNIDDIALTYLELLERLNLHDVIVIGSSMGGWIASEMAVRDTSRLGGIILLDGVGIEVPGHEIADVFTMTPAELSAKSYHNPAVYGINPAAMSPEQLAGMAANFKTLAVYSQARGMHDPKLARRLGRVKTPVMVVWGESDKVIDPEYGRAFAQAFPNSRFKLIQEAGHLPHIEQPERVLKLVLLFADKISSTAPTV